MSESNISCPADPQEDVEDDEQEGVEDNEATTDPPTTQTEVHSPSTDTQTSSRRRHSDMYTEYLKCGVTLAKAKIRKMELEEEKLKEETAMIQLKKQKLQMEVALLMTKVVVIEE